MTLHERVLEAWPAAQALWSPFLLLKEPQDGRGPIAHIDLRTRQIHLDYAQLEQHDLQDACPALLAHEVGHHVRWPATLETQARLRILEKTLIPLDNYSLINCFTDLLINHHLKEHQRDFVRVYQKTVDLTHWDQDPAFPWYLAIYEELWNVDLLGRARQPFEKAFPGARADAAWMAQDLFSLGPNLYTQFLFFISVASRYVLPESSTQDGCAHAPPSPEEVARALTPSCLERQAIERALREGWVRGEAATRLGEARESKGRISGLPGDESAEAQQVPEIMAAWYRLEAERYIVRPPPVRMLGEALVPTTLEEWEPGDSPHEIDWRATLARSGAELGAAQPFKRVLVAEEQGWDVPLWQPYVEIYLDVSGSMPNPIKDRNTMTLAALILGLGGIRAGGCVRAILYSTGPVVHWEWCRSELELSLFLMHYVGGGTDFPFDLLEKSVEECGGTQPIRLIVTDADFDHNYDEKPANADIFARAARLSPRLALVTCGTGDEHARRYRTAGAAVVGTTLEDFPRMAANLSHALFAEAP